MKADDNSCGEALPIRGNSSWFPGFESKGPSRHTCSFSHRLSEMVAKNHERGMPYNSLGTRINLALLFAEQTHCAYYDQINPDDP
jgi:hypothetical protein